MVALGLLERAGDLYATGRRPPRFLTGRTPADLRPFLRFWDRISYPAWTTLAEALGRRQPPRQIFDLDDELQEIVSAGIEAVLAGPAAALPRAVDLSASGRLLDVGGGTGSWSIAACAASPAPRAPPSSSSPWSRSIAPASASPQQGWTGRVEVVARRRHGRGAADAGTTSFLIANLLHYWSRRRTGPCWTESAGVGAAGRTPAARRLLDRRRPTPSRCTPR